MVIDSSVLIAILRNESEVRILAQALTHAESCLISAGTLLEASIVIQALYGDNGLRDLDNIIVKHEIQIVDFTKAQAESARRAYRRYGKGHHAARLNFGDCIAYALAKDLGEPLLFKGDGFSKTDIEAVAF